MDIERHIQLQEAALLEVEAAIDRLQKSESPKGDVTRSQKKRQEESERRETSRPNAMIDSCRPALRMTERGTWQKVELALHERKTKNPEHQVITNDGYLVPPDGGVGVNRLVEPYGNTQVVEP